MTSDSLDVEDWDQPQRDGRGRFRKGSSGNRYGRPRKQARQWSMTAALAEALAEEVTVAAPGGTQQSIQMRDLLIKALIRAATKAKAKDLIFILEWLMKLNAFTHLEEEDEERTDDLRRDAQWIMAKLERDFPELAQQGPLGDLAFS